MAKVHHHLTDGVTAAPDPVIGPDGVVSAAALCELHALVASRCVAAKPHPKHPSYVLYNYTSLQQIHGKWTPMARLCRGLVLHTVNDCVSVVARPLPKFFNLGDSNGGKLEPGASIAVYDKVDGSLGIVFHVPELGGWIVNTRGSWQSPQAVTATNMLRALDTSALDTAHTYCFEIVYPENRIVVKYGDTRELTLLFGADTKTGVELDDAALATTATALRCAKANLHGQGVVPAECKDVALVRAWVMATYGKPSLKGDEAEGFVLVSSSLPGVRAKVKYEAYTVLHRAASATLTDVIAWEAASSGKMEELRDVMSECHDELQALYTTWEDVCAAARAQVMDTLASLPPGATRGQAAAVFKSKGALSHALFAALTHGIDSAACHNALWKLVKPTNATIIVKRPGSHTTF